MQAVIINGLITCVNLMVLASLSWAQTITTQPSTQDVMLGKTAQFECLVQNLQQGQHVIWKFVDHNVTISVGETQQGDLHNSRYSIVRLQDTEGFWNLQISDVRITDSGTYMCYVQGMEKSVFVRHHLNITDAPPKETPVDFDVTDCCTANDIETCALPLCNTATPLTSLFPIFANDTCISTNIFQVMSCGQDGRNHLGCCMRSGLPEICLAFCEGWGTVDDSLDYTQCIPYAVNIISCLKEGHTSIPSQPTSVAAVAAGTRIFVSWRPPLDNPEMVDHYKIQYRPKDTTQEYKYTSVDEDKAVLSGILHVNEVNVAYEVKVIAVGNSGASQPSYAVDVTTREDPGVYEGTISMQKCCQNHSVSMNCMDYCVPGFFSDSLLATGIEPCYSDVNTILQCFLNHGNHTPCCSRVNVPDTCLPLCQGSFILTFDLTTCLPYTTLISACVSEGATYLPSPPQNTHIVAGSVTPTSVTVAWDKPASFSLGDYFNVAWKQQSYDQLSWQGAEITLGTQYTISGLDQATVYEVVVTTVNQNGSSLPDQTLVVVTEAFQANVPVFNETQCCVNYGVSANCLAICDHNFRLSNDVYAKAVTCLEYIEEMLWCAADNRDHTACCTREQLPEKCLPLCYLKRGETPSLEFTDCFVYKDSLSKCFDEGKVVLPYAPAEFAVKSVDVTSVLLNWQNPGGPNITSYVVEKAAGKTPFVQLPETLNTFMKVEDLTGNTLYYFRVRSKNEAGTSLSSDVIEAITLQYPFVTNETTQWQQLWSNRTHCCDSSVTEECRQACIDGDLSLTSSCASQIDKMLPCSADGMDHSACCQRWPMFPTSCLPLCKGQSLQQNLFSALCTSVYSAVLSCFTEGQGLLPLFPANVRVSKSKATSITLSWDRVTTNCNTADSCYYIIMIWLKDDMSSLVRNKTRSLSITQSNLSPSTMYRISVVTRNENGQSLPSPYIYHQTDQQDTETTISISQSPPSVINSNSSVQLDCAGIGQPVARIVWYRNSLSVSSSSILIIKVTGESEAGLYECDVTFKDGHKQTSSWQLNVKYIPKPKRMKVVEAVLPGIHKNARIQCDYAGYPDVIHWTKDGGAVTGTDKYNIQFWTNPKLGITSSELVIKDVVTKDFGNYTCDGRNMFGTKTISTGFSMDFPGSTIPPSTPNNKTFYDDCCKSHGIPQQCRDTICTYAINLESVISDVSLYHCLEHFKAYLICGSDRKDHSQCCTKRGVADLCLPLCAGQIPDDIEAVEYLSCTQHATDITECAILGMQYIPSPPESVTAQVSDDTIIVRWQWPQKNADKVDRYDVFYMSQTVAETVEYAGSDAKYRALDHKENIQKGQTYSIWVKAENNHGLSHKSNIVNLTVTVLTPPPPKNLLNTNTEETTISLSWYKPDTDVTVAKYFLYYKVATSAVYKKMSVAGTSVILVDLTPGTTYDIYVVAVNAEGQEGSHRNVISVTTGGTAAPVSSGQTGGGESAGVAVGIVLGIIFLVAVAVISVMFYRRFLRKQNPGPKDTVSFENPQYAARQQTVTGLPGESNDGNSFNYGQLREEHDVDPGYITMTTNHQPQSGLTGIDNPAIVQHDEA